MVRHNKFIFRWKFATCHIEIDQAHTESNIVITFRHSIVLSQTTVYSDLLIAIIKNAMNIIHLRHRSAVSTLCTCALYVERKVLEAPSLVA